MGKKPVLPEDEHKGLKLARDGEQFKLTISEKIDNGYEIKELDSSAAKEFHQFVSDTVYKKLTVSQVESLYMRSKDSLLDEGSVRNSVHLGKDGKKFRLFGYYNLEGYFVITRIDGKHKTHKS